MARKPGPKEAQRIALRTGSGVPHAAERLERQINPPIFLKPGSFNTVVDASPDEVARALRFYRKHRERQRLAGLKRRKAKKEPKS
jgi:hypothetical protein